MHFFHYLARILQAWGVENSFEAKQTYDQIGLFSNDTRLPTPDNNIAGR